MSMCIYLHTYTTWQISITVLPFLSPIVTQIVVVIIKLQVDQSWRTRQAAYCLKKRVEFRWSVLAWDSQDLQPAVGEINCTAQSPHHIRTQSVPPPTRAELSPPVKSGFLHSFVSGGRGDLSTSLGHPLVLPCPQPRMPLPRISPVWSKLCLSSSTSRAGPRLRSGDSQRLNRGHSPSLEASCHF